MVHQHINIQNIQRTCSLLLFTILRGITSVMLGFLTSRCYLFEGFSPFSLILLTVSSNLKLFPALCYLSSSIGYLSYQFDLTTIKYIIALTMTFVIYTVLRKASNELRDDSIVFCGISCAAAGLITMAIEKFTLFEILLLISESVLISCCVFFINYAAKALKRSCFLTAKEIVSAAITLILLLLLLKDIYILQMNLARICAVFIFLLALYCLKISHAALLGSCLGIILSAIGGGGDAVFTAIIVAGFASCVISGFSLRLSSTVFVAAYDLILLFFGKFPWNYPMFAEPFIAFAISSLLPKDKLRILLSRYIVVRSKEKKAKTNQKIIDACKKECLILCPKAKICYEENLENLKDALESLTEKYCSTEEFGNIEDVIPFCIKPHTMAHIIKNRLVFTHSEDFEDLIDQLDHISWKMKQKFEACTHDVHFLTDAEDEIKKSLEKRGIVVKDINFTEDECQKRRCDLQYTVANDQDNESIIKDVLSKHFKNGLSIAFKHENAEYSAHAKDKNTFKISCAALCKSKNGEQICGDHAIGFSANKDTYYLMLADGMGSGREASVQSELIIDTLHKLINSGLTVPNALNIYHSASRLRNNSCFTTIDVCSINLNTASADFFKGGAFDTYHISENQISTIPGGGLPIGLSEREKLAHHSKKLSNGDYIVMVSDGIGALGEQIDLQISQCMDENVRVFAKNILNRIPNPENTALDDDVTIIVCEIKQNNDE